MLTLNGITLTRRQEWSLREILDSALDGYGQPRKHDVKVFEVRGGHAGSLFVRIETGQINDEGSLASILCRKRGLFRIGRLGAIAPLSKDRNASKSKALKHPLIYGWET